MSIRQSVPRFSLRLSSPVKPSSRRFFSTSQSPSPKDPQSRLRRLNDRLPRFLRSYTTPLIGAPGTHITSFLILHELTAIVPLFGLVAAFHYGNWLPDLTSSIAFEEGTRRFGRWLRKKGWIEEDVDMATVTADGPTTGHSHGDTEKKGVRLVLEFATAYAVTKALLPIRIAASVWATPWFARAVLSPVGRGIRRVFGRN